MPYSPILIDDSEGRSWDVSITYGSLRRVLAQTGLDLSAPLDPLAIAQRRDVAFMINSSVLTLLDVLWALCQPEAVREKIKREDFEAAFEGDPLAAAQAAILQGLTDFFRRNRRESEAAYIEELAAEWKTAREKSSSPSANALQESSESTPAP